MSDNAHPDVIIPHQQVVDAYTAAIASGTSLSIAELRQAAREATRVMLTASSEAATWQHAASEAEFELEAVGATPEHPVRNRLHTARQRHEALQRIAGELAAKLREFTSCLGDHDRDREDIARALELVAKA